MFPLALVVFRDTLEVTLFIGILATALRGLVNKNQLISLGVVLGLLGSILLAWGSDVLKSSLSGHGGDWFQVVVLTAVFAMLVWHILWASQHARELTGEARALGRSAADGSSSVWAVVAAISIVTLREGAEIVLYVLSVSNKVDAPLSAVDFTVGSLAGLSVGVALGYLVYKGFSRISIKKMFNVTNVLVALMAAGMAGRLGKRLVKLDVLPSGANPLWDSGTWIAEDKPLGLFLHALIGYTAKPTTTHLIFFVAGLGLIVGLLAWRGRSGMLPSFASKAAR